MTHYLIEFRFSGYAKDMLRELTSSISKNFHVYGTTRRRVVPHITLAGPLYTDDEKKLVKEIKNIASKYKLVGFKLDGFGRFGKNVIYTKIMPSEEMQKIRSEIVKKLEKFCDMQDHDYEVDYHPHATLAFKDIEKKFDKIWEFLQGWKIPQMNQYVLRITIIKNQKILYEYDLILGKLLDRTDSLDRAIFKKTIHEFNKIREKLDIKNKIIEFENVSNNKIFLASDTHFDHQNIIKYCRRPFRNAEQMNSALIRNWNSVVGEDDVVYFLGDMSYGRGRRPIDYWLGKLNGKIHFIRGNHDTDAITRANVIQDRYGIRYGKYEFLLMHEPRRPLGWDGWIIHGDKHNNSLEEFPHINRKNMTINVCVEVIGYTPISLDDLIEEM